MTGGKSGVGDGVLGWAIAIIRTLLYIILINGCDLRAVPRFGSLGFWFDGSRALVFVD